MRATTRRRHLAIGLVAATLTCSGFIPSSSSAASLAAGAPFVPNTLTAGDGHTCMIAADGHVWCWGDNALGQLGNGTKTSSVAPVQVSGLADAVEVSAGADTTCARTAGGTAWCWGAGLDGELGDGISTGSSVPVAVSGIVNAISISAGGLHACAVLSTGSIRCWGSNSSGELGDNSDIGSTTPVDVVGISDAVSVEAGDAHTCAVRAGGMASCWGNNGDGQLGDSTVGSSSAIPVGVPGLTDAAKVTAADYHTCAMTSDGESYCWGDGYYGQLGDGTGGGTAGLHHVLLINGVVDIGANGDDSCAVTSDGQAYCWGSGDYGHLGNGTEDVQYAIPTPVSGLSDAVAIASGADHACAIRVSGSVTCWGRSRYGQVGAGLPDQVWTATMVPGLSGATDVAAADDFTCALLQAGTVQCWGYNIRGQLGDGDTRPTVGPIGVVGISTATAIEAGGNSACAALADATMRCWGGNGSGQLGDGTKTDSAQPVQPAISSVDRVAIGADHACARVTGGDLYCWGSNYLGQLGDGTHNEHLTPTIIPTVSNGGSITVGGNHSCSRLFNNQVMCWGYNNSGQVGDNTFVEKDSPTAVDIAINSFLQVDAGGNHTCAARLLHVYCWGSNGNGQLGDGSGSNQSVPTLVPGVPGGLVSAGTYHTCLAEPTGAVECWGSNAYGQLGDGTTTGRPAPTPVAGLTDIVQIAAGGSHTCAVRSDMTVWCWGKNSDGEIGQPSKFLTPVAVAGVAAIVPAPEVPLVPARLLDTRPGSTTIDGQFAGQGQQHAGTTLEVAIAGRGAIPTNAAAVVVNVTAVDATAPGFITVYPCDAPRPLASSLNYSTGQTIPNELIAKLSAGGTLCLFTLAATDLIVDATGWLPPTPGYTPLVPARLLDTRPGNPTLDNQFAGIGRRDAGSTLQLDVGGRGGVPTGAAAAVVNITAVDPSSAGFVTVYPCDASPPLASSLNFAAGATIPNELISKLSSTGTICLYTTAAVDLVVDVTGWLPITPAYTALVPARLLDTRSGALTIDRQYSGLGQRGPGTTIELAVDGRGGVPNGAAAVVLNVTVVDAAGAGFVTVYPCDAPRPLASSLNFTVGQVIPNELVTKLSPTGTVCLYTIAAIDLVVDVTGTMS